MDDALVGVAHREVGDTELGGVHPERVDLLGRDRISDRLIDVLGRDVVVLGRNGELGAAHRASGESQAVEGLRARDFVDEVEVDVDEVGFAVTRLDEVALPHFFRQCLSHGFSPRSILRYPIIWDTFLRI